MSDQRAAIKAYARAGKTATEALQLLHEAFGELAFGRSRVFELFKQFKEGRESIEDDRGKCPKPKVRTDENVAVVSSLLKMDGRSTIKDLALECDLSVGTIHTIIHKDLGLSKVSARWVPRLLSDNHKQQHLEMARNFNKSYFNQGKAFLESIITMDESWVLYYTPETKQQSKQWVKKGSNPPVKAKVVGSAKKVMLVVFFDFKGIIYSHYVPQGKTINSEYHIEVMSTFLKCLKKKRPEKLQLGWLLHQDNARPHTSKLTSEFMEAKGIKTLFHAPYSPDLAPCDFWLFPQLKRALAGQKFDTDNEIRIAVQGVFNDLTKEGTLFVFETWHKRLTKCIELNGDYVEKMQ
jgi:histone-lysine N-methyltransferase SETMAR